MSLYFVCLDMESYQYSYCLDVTLAHHLLHWLSLIETLNLND